MVAWVNAQLDQQRTIDPTFGGLGITNWFAWIAACHGNMQPVRVLFPWLAPFLQPRRFGRGEHPRHKRQWAIDRAVEDVVRIRALWLKHYGSYYRPRGQVTAEEIAEGRHDVDADTLRNALK
jgi:hypothetical protein